MRNFDFSSWSGILSTLLGLALFTLIGVGVRVVMMLTIQQRQQRMNRQINERLRTLISAYRVLGGSFTGDLAVDPTHFRELKARAVEGEVPVAGGASDRARRIRDAVEAALSDIILLGTEEHVRLAERAARELVAGQPVRTVELVVALRDYIRQALDLEPVPEGLAIPPQGPTRPASGGSGRGRGDREGHERGGSGSGRGEGGGAAMGGAAGLGLGLGLGHEDEPPTGRRA